MNKYINEQNKVHELIDKYQKNLDAYLNKDYNETQTRTDFVNPFFEILGWDIDNKQKLPPKSREVFQETSVNVEENGKYRTKKPDYAFKAGTEIIYYLETKKPSIDINTDKQSSFQLRRYGWSGNVAISILTNFNDLYIYDCSIRPKETDSNLIALVKHYNYKEYIEKFDEIYELLSKEAVIKGLFQEKTKEINKIREKESFDFYFLKQIKKWRLELGEDIYKNNSYLSANALNIFVQRILNRILFLRICEDRNLELYETLKSIDNYNQLKELFSNADKKYNSGLFAIMDKEQLNVSDDVLINIFQELYYPKSPYEFSVVDSYIMGQIYELFLDEELIIENEQIKTQIKQDIVDIHGTVNTPKNVTDIIVEKSLDKWIHSHSLKDIYNIKIADICCGSGNFLISAYEYLIDYYTTYFQENDFETNYQKGYIFYSYNKQEYLLSLKLRKEILKNNIFGCDIDPLACEITKFNLLLKTIEDIPEAEIDELYNIQKEKALPSLESNIKNGNSLIDDNYLQFNKNLYNDINLVQTLKPFNWDIEFPFGKFDVIVGNPPYIRVQKLVHFVEKEYAYYKSPFSGYITAQTELIDKYYLFVERIKQLLNTTGVAGVIIPHKFMLIKSGNSLRTLLTKEHSVVEVINFGTKQIFKGKDTYTCILIFSKVEQKQFDIAFINDLPEFLFTHKCPEKSFPIDYLNSSPWIFLPPEIENKLTEIKNSTIPLKAVTDIFVGLQTSNDKIYILFPENEDENYIYCKEKDGSSFKIEKQILRNCIYDIQLHCYEKIKSNCYLIYPYYEKDGKPVLYSIEEMQNNYPETYKYLLRHKEKLDERNINNRNETNWFQFGRSQSLKRFIQGEHLIWSVLALSGNYVYDNSLITFTGGGNGPFYGLTLKENSSYSIFYIQALLNHWLLELLVRNKASNFRGDYYSHGKQFIAELPIRKIDFYNSNEKKAHDDIVNKVSNLMKLSEQKNKSLTKTEADIIERAIQSEKRLLENMIDELYNVTELKIGLTNETTR